MNVEDISSMEQFLGQCGKTGFQATNLGAAREILNAIFSQKRKNKDSMTIYLGFTANLVASGMRGYISKLARENLIDAIVTTGGAIEHDVIKSFLDYELGSFNENDAELHTKGINRIGNILVKNECYELMEKISYSVFEDFVLSNNKMVSPSEISESLGKYIEKNSKKKEASFLYWAYKNKIPVFSPGIIDSAMGMHTYFFKQKHKDFGIDATKDMKKLADITLNAEKTSALILGGGISKHHIIGVNILRGGLDHAVYVTTAVEYDGSLSGARHNEAVSWGKLKSEKSAVTIHGDVSLILPMLLENLV